MAANTKSNTNGVGYYLRSLLITAVVTFVLPLILLGGMQLLLLILQTLLPGLPAWQHGAEHLQSFLIILGNGHPWQGGLVIGLVSSLVGILFDTYAFYRYQGVSHRGFP